MSFNPTEYSAISVDVVTISDYLLVMENNEIGTGI
jgi:hypothetical protein